LSREKLEKAGEMADKIPEISKEKQKLRFRIKRIRGQFAAVERALTAGDECADILMLLAAIRGGVNGWMAEVLEDHIRLHIMNPDHAVDSPEELGEDLIGLVRAYLKWAGAVAGRITSPKKWGQLGAPRSCPWNPPG
jgi:DNA-binding FrmR family transcriptional regulator